MTFSLAIVGRPNVGKSTLFNRLVGKKLALVDDRPGVTRDRREGQAKLADLTFTVIDTAGLEEGADSTLIGRMRRQTEAAVEQADAILFMIDARVGVTPDDKYFADLVRRADKPVILAANKAEGRVGEAGVLDAYTLGLGDPVPLSAEHGEGMIDLFDALRLALPELTGSARGGRGGGSARPELAEDEDGSDLDLSKPLRIAVVGRPNAGKSTLINRLLGEERLLTGPEAGITRDSIGIDFKWRERKMKLFDTAGLRKRARVVDKLEKLAGADALRAVRFAEVVVLLVDSAIPFEKQDLTIADIAASEGRAVVIGLNKWDAVEDRGKTLTTLREEAERLLPQLRGCKVVPVSGTTGFGLEALMQAIIETHEVWNKRISTGRLNRWLESALSREPAARRFRTAHQDPLRHAAQEPPAAFHLLRQSARRVADKLRALSDQQPAQVLRSAGRADPHLAPHGREPLCGRRSEARDAQRRAPVLDEPQQIFQNQHGSQRADAAGDGGEREVEVLQRSAVDVAEELSVDEADPGVHDDLTVAKIFLAEAFGAACCDEDDLRLARDLWNVLGLRVADGQRGARVDEHVGERVGRPCARARSRRRAFRRCPSRKRRAPCRLAASRERRSAASSHAA